MSATYAEVIGDPIAHSKSPRIHNFWLEKLGREHAYGMEQVTPDALETYISSRVGDPEWRGCNITMPHKQAIISMIDRLEPLAKRVGAVNTKIHQEAKNIVNNL